MVILFVVRVATEGFGCTRMLSVWAYADDGEAVLRSFEYVPHRCIMFASLRLCQFAGGSYRRGKGAWVRVVHEIRRASGYTSIKFLKYIDAGKLARMAAIEAGGAMADSDGESAGNGVPMLD